MLHTIAPVFDENARTLILGSFPSVISREQQFFYGHPQNRFWPLLAALFESKIPQTLAEKRALLLENGLALWDVIASCDIEGSADSSIRNVVPNDQSIILGGAQITRIFTNGGTADALYRKYCMGKTGLTARCLPSTSPANARFGFDKLLEAWRAVL